MKNLNEKEILSLLHVRRKNYKVPYEEIINPNYELWGRAREWSYSQAVCLIAGLTPLSLSHFKLLVNNRSLLDLVHWYIYYPTSPEDRNRLQNIDRIFDAYPSLDLAKNQNQTLKPKPFLDLCKDDEGIGPFLPQALIEVVDKLGFHPSLNLPSTFSLLEVNPTALENLKKLKKRKKMPQVVFNTEENNPPTLPIPPSPSEPPLVIAKRLFPLNNTERWKKADVLALNEIVLLHYGIDPIRLYHSPPLGEAPDDVTKEFLDYLSRYFFGDRQWFIGQLDENKLCDLLQRSIDAGAIKPSHGSNILREEVMQWMEAKQLSFPLYIKKEEAPKSEKNEISKEDLLNYNLCRLTENQLARLMARSAAAILWKQSPSFSLQQVTIQTYFKNVLALVQKMIGKTDNFDEKTVDDWIRDLNPNYKPKK